MKKFPHIQQLGIKDCGPACLKMIGKWYGKSFDLNFLRQKCSITKIGVSMLGISEAAEAIGFRTLGVKVTTDKLIKAMDAGPCIIHWQQNHFVVLYKVKRSLSFFRVKRKYQSKLVVSSSVRRSETEVDVSRNEQEKAENTHPLLSSESKIQDNKPLSRGEYFFIADPAKGLLKLSSAEFIEKWKGSCDKGYALLLEPSKEFYSDIKEGEESKADFSILWPYFLRYKRYLLQIVLGMALGSGIALVGPFLTQALVDTGIHRQDLGFVYMVLLAQVALFLGSTFIEIIRSWILMHIGTRINISMVSDFLKNCSTCPFGFTSNT